MANQEQLAILTQGVEVWNQWRKEHTDVQPLLSEADLSGATLSGASITKEQLEQAKLLEGATMPDGSKHP